MGEHSLARRTFWLLRTLPAGARWWLVRRLVEPRASRIQRLREVLGDPGARLVFVCHGNIMRSAFSAHVARAAVPDRAQQIVSTGTHAKPGREAEATAVSVAALLGYDLSSHRASSFAGVELSTRDLVVCMDRGNEARVLHYLGQGQRVFLVGDIDDMDTGHVHPGSQQNVGAVGAAGETGPGLESAAPEVDRSRELPDPYGKGADVTRWAFLRLRSRAELWARRHFVQSQAQP